MASPAATDRPPLKDADEARRRGEAFLAALDRARPDLTRAPRVPGKPRGVDVYGHDDLCMAMGFAADIFERRHGRAPDLVGLPQCCDHFFAVKFFEPLASPNPADKLNTHRFVPEPMRGRALRPGRPWASAEPALPPEDAVPARRYMLKVALGNAQMVPVDWPPSLEARARCDALLRKWFARRYGLRWGEWWYSAGRQRAFLETHIGERIKGRPEYRVYVREGRVAAFYLTLYLDRKGTGNRLQAVFDAEKRRLPVMGRGATPWEGALPAWINDMLAVAGGMGRSMRICRVDFMDVGADRPCISEITLCDNNARRLYETPEMDRIMRDLLFG